MRILVTGAAGFIGKRLIKTLLSSNRADVCVALDNLAKGCWDSLEEECGDGRVVPLQGDVRDPCILEKACRGVDTVFHLAAVSSVGEAEAEPLSSWQINVNGTENVLRAAKNAGARRCVFASSREVYGQPTAMPVHETASLRPENRYGESKEAGEALCREYSRKGLGVSIARLTNVYGPKDSGRVIPIFAERVRRGLPLIIHGGEQVIDFAPISLVCEGLIRMALREIDEPVNIGSGRGTTLQELASRIASLPGALGGGVEYRAHRSFEVKRFVADVGRQVRLLGLIPPRDPLEMLPETLDAVGLEKAPVEPGRSALAHA